MKQTFCLLLAIALAYLRLSKAQLPNVPPNSPPSVPATVQVSDIQQLLPIVGTKFATFDIEIQPGDSGKEEDLTSELIGDGFGQPLFYLKDSRFLPGELEAAEDNIFLPLSFPHAGNTYNENAQTSNDENPRFMAIRSHR